MVKLNGPQSHLFCHSWAVNGLASVQIGNFWSIFSVANVTHLRGGGARLTHVFVVDYDDGLTTDCWRFQ
jgi:hypothetical protein